MVMLRRFASTNLYLVDGLANPGDARFAVVVDPLGPTPATLILDNTWGDARYAIFPRTIAGQILQHGGVVWTSFALDLRQRIGWFEAPNNIVKSVSLPRLSPLGAGISRPLELQFLNYSLRLPERSTIHFGPQGFLFDGSAAPLRPEIRLDTHHVPIVNNLLSLDVIDERNQGVSRFVGDVMMQEDRDPARPSDFDRLNVGVRYFRKQSTSVEDVVSQRFSVFHARRSAGIPMRIVLDYFHHAPPTTPQPGGAFVEDSYLAFQSGTAVGSFLRSAFGYELVLSPEGRDQDAARLVFSLQRDTLDPRIPLRAFYLAPRGLFRITDAVDPTGRTALSDRSFRLVCGNSGAEYVFFRRGDLVRFVPYQNAFYALADGTDFRPARRRAGQGLSGEAYTSWLRVFADNGGSAPNYRAQPDDAPLYTPFPKDPDIQIRRRAAVGQDVYEFQQVPIAPLDDSVRSTFPLAPVDGFRPIVRAADPTVVEEYTSLESIVLQPMRRALLTPVLPPVDQLNPPAFQDTITPQGFLVSVAPDSGYRYETLKIARSEPGDGRISAQFLEFRKVHKNQDLERALKQNRLFAVISQLPPGGVTFADELEIVSWIFSVKFDRNEPVGRRTLLIFKFYEGKSVEELCDDISVWAENLFVDSDHDALRQYINSIKDKSKEEDDREIPEAKRLYRGILDRLVDAKWNGVLAINLPFSGNCLPSPLRGLSIGIENQAFRINHVGVDASRFQQSDPAQPAIELIKSSLFALIDYERPGQAGRFPAGSHFNMSVEELKVVFERSALRFFFALVRLDVIKVFRETAQSSDGANEVRVIGSYEKKNGRDVYTFLSNEEHRLDFDDVNKTAFIRSLTIRRAEMTTESTPSSEDVVARFTLTGALDLGEGLNLYFLRVNEVEFHELIAEFEFKLPASGVPSNPELTRFQPGLLSFNMDKAERHPNAILSALPLRLRKFFFNVGTDENPPPMPLSKIGFLPLIASAGGDAAFDYGFSFELDLGTLGALVSSLRAFKAEVFLGWKVDDPRNLALGIRLPEGKLRIGIEGVFELEVQQFRVDIDTASTPPKYKIILDNCFLRIFGKQFPSSGTLDVALFPNPNDPLGSPAGWLGLYDQGSQFFGLAQRIAIDPGDPPTYQAVVDALRNLIQNPNSVQYSRENEWTVAAQFPVVEVAVLGAVFNDPALYALRLEIVGLFGIDVVYRKVAEDLGVYAVELRLPDEVRNIEMGAASLTLPVFGVSVYTNGDFRIDLGFPWKVDFSRCFKLQILPFVGAGGFYVGRLSGRSSSLLPSDQLTAVAVFGFGLSVGLGKEFEKGIFRFGVSISLYGIFEGALGYLQGNNEVLKPNAFALAGRVGILAQLFGVVDFGIIKVNVTITIEIGMPFRIRRMLPEDRVTFSVPGVEANVLVVATVVVGEMKVLGRRIAIEVQLRYELHLQLRFPIGEQEEELRFHSGAGEIDWQRPWFDDLYLVLHA